METMPPTRLAIGWAVRPGEWRGIRRHPHTRQIARYLHCGFGVGRSSSRTRFNAVLPPRTSPRLNAAMPASASAPWDGPHRSPMQRQWRACAGPVRSPSRAEPKSVGIVGKQLRLVRSERHRLLVSDHRVVIALQELVGPSQHDPAFDIVGLCSQPQASRLTMPLHFGACVLVRTGSLRGQYLRRHSDRVAHLQVEHECCGRQGRGSGRLRRPNPSTAWPRRAAWRARDATTLPAPAVAVVDGLRAILRDSARSPGNPSRAAPVGRRRGGAQRAAAPPPSLLVPGARAVSRTTARATSSATAASHRPVMAHLRSASDSARACSAGVAA